LAWLARTKDDPEAYYLLGLVRDAAGRLKEAAELLGLTYKTLQYRLKKHEIDRHDPLGEG